MTDDKLYEIKKLDWDTNFFGVPSCKVVLREIITDSVFDSILDKTKKFKFVTIQNNSNLDGNNSIIGRKSNSFLTDINVQFLKKIDNELTNIDYDDRFTIVNNLDANDCIMNIASTSFIYSRFMADNNLNNGDKVYYNWVKNAFNKEDKFFSLYTENGLVLGFILFSIDNDIIVLELVAVDKSVRGKNIGYKLEKHIENFAMKNNIKEIHVGTQLNNIPAQNFYIKCGFKHKEFNSIYHMWR